jgi:hypothetical protein
MPHAKLCGMVRAEREGGHDLERELAGAEFVEQFGRHLAEFEALLDVPFADAEARGDLVDRRAGVDQCRHRGEFVRRVHRGAHRVFHQRGFERRLVFLDEARRLVIGRDHALGSEFLQRLQATAAGRDGIKAVPLGRGADDQVLFQPAGLDARFQLGVFSRRRRRLASIGGGEHELAETDVLDFAAGGYGGGPSVTGGRETSLALENPSQIPSPSSSSEDCRRCRPGKDFPRP